VTPTEWTADDEKALAILEHLRATHGDPVLITVHLLIAARDAADLGDRALAERLVGAAISIAVGLRGQAMDAARGAKGFGSN